MNETKDWVKDFQDDTNNWYMSLMSDLQKGRCLMCGITPGHILNVSRLIPAEIDKARDNKLTSKEIYDNGYNAGKADWEKEFDEDIDIQALFHSELKDLYWSKNHVKSFISSLLDKAREEGRQARFDDKYDEQIEKVRKTIGGEAIYQIGVKEEKTRILGIVDEIRFKPELTSIHEYETGWNESLETLKEKLND